MQEDRAHELVREGREALIAANWDRARSCFEQARQLGDTAEVLDGLTSSRSARHGRYQAEAAG